MIKVPINEKEFVTFENIDLFLQEYNPNNKYLCVIQAKEYCGFEEISSCLNYIKNYFILNCTNWSMEESAIWSWDTFVH